MDYKYIEQLLERYFNAESSPVEEQILRTFFSQNEVPAHLSHYAPLFLHEQEECEQSLGADFDRRLLDRLEEQGDAPVMRVKMRKMTLAARLRPLWRSAAAVAIVALLGISAREAWEQSPISPVLGGSQAQWDAPRDSDFLDPQRTMENGMKMAITGDSLQATDEALVPDVPPTLR